MSNKINTQFCNLEITIKADDLSIIIGSENFTHYIRDESYSIQGRPSVGLSLPAGELAFETPDTDSILKLLSKQTTNVEIQYKDIGDNKSSIIHKYLVTNFDIKYTIKGAKITMYMIADLAEFITTTKQKSYPKQTFEQVIKTLQSIEPKLDQGVTTDDQMTWIQNNISDYQFISQSIKHARPTDKDDLILTAINNDKLRVRSFKEAISETSKQKINFFTTGNTTDNDKSYKTYNSISELNLETSIGVYQYKLSVETLPVLRILGDKTDDTWLLSSWLSSSNKVAPFKSDRVQAPKLDCGNTHNLYWEIQLANEKKLANIYRNLTYITINGANFIDNLNLLDTAYLDLQSTASDRYNNPLTGNFVIFGISRYINSGIVSNRITLAKDEYK